MKDIKHHLHVKYMIPVVFVVIMALRIVSYGNFMLDTFYECFLSAIYGLWGVSVFYRITDEACKRLFVKLSGMMILWEIIRTVKYHHLTNPLAVRIAWYSFYIPMLMMAVFSFLLAKVLLSHDGKKTLKKYAFLKGIAYALILLVLTNELHKLVFVFPKGIKSGNPDYTYGIGYFLILAFILIMVIATLVTLVKKCSLPESRRYLYIPISLIGICIALLVLYEMGAKPMVAGVNLFTLPDLICLFQIVIWESLFFIGLVPKNDGYYDIFIASSIGAEIVDDNGTTILCKASEKWTENENMVLNEVPILGGKLRYSKDFTQINKIKEELLEAKEIIAGENLLIEEENKLLEENSKYQRLNQVYDEIAKCVHDRTIKVEELLRGEKVSKEEFDKRLSKACFINAYIKRRSNLILQSKQEGELYIMELYLGLVESMNYLSLSNVEGFVRPYKGDEKLPAEMLFMAYDFFEDIVEETIEQLSAIMIDLHLEGDEFVIRMVMDLRKTQGLRAIVAGYDTAELTEDEDGTIAVLRLKKGGVK